MPQFPGTMMDEPLLLSAIVTRAEQLFRNQVIVSYGADGHSSEIDCATLMRRVRKLASALSTLGIKEGDRVATFAWNTQEHLELYLAAPCIGAVIHPLNIRLHADELAFIINDAEDSVVVVESDLSDRLPALPDGVRRIVIGRSATALEADDLDYETFVDSGDEDFEFPRFPESAACTMCYTGGTTGRPKGVVYTHRSTMLHTVLESLPDFYGICESDVVVPFVPMFHANAWGLPYATLLAGGRLVLPGPLTAPEAMAAVLSEQRATVSAGVPTIWHGMGELDQLPDLSSLRMVVAGGAPLTAALLKRFDELDIPMVQGFGMTEANPLVAVGRVPHRSTASGQALMDLRLSQGRPMPLVDVRVDDSMGGELQVRGSTITGEYFRRPPGTESQFTEDGWLRTGDVAEISDEGVIRIVDRTKDMIKSGGEWIPSAELENAIGEHPLVREVTVIARPDDRWGERPVAYVTATSSAPVSVNEIADYLADRVPRWWIPEDVVVIDTIPRTSVGKFDKKRLRDEHNDR
ncbi:fatty-acyl-CoA synthase [Rhodococcus koreensis]|uniref:Fatty-acyl-CoA synthase n=2 Tax=Rhodococcus koreensis TaxID=99653 RepID=A0A1H4L054_9NOCA|nr:fatty-acyl-CoA synthase [Rhodococcus koreensis]